MIAERNDRRDLRESFFDRLPGRWAAHRVIEGTASFEGTATLEPLTPDRLAYREEGVLKLPHAAPITAHRAYLYERRPDGFAILFSETPPRLFQEFTLAVRADGALAGSSRHPCAADFYETTCVVREDAFWLIHRVNGPRKGYVSTTRYEPCAAAFRR